MADLREVTKAAREQAARIESLEEENESLKARIAGAEADKRDAAAQAVQHVNALMNRH